MADTQKSILVGGASHVGKSTLCIALGKQLGWEVFSTDSMARHPGRPWPTARPHVVEFYKSMSSESIFTFLLHHHGNMRASIQGFLMDRIKAGSPSILEGSALRPEFLSALGATQFKRVCLVAPDTFIVHRIRATSGYADQSTESRLLIDVFVERSIRDNRAVIEAAEKHEIECVDCSDAKEVGKLYDRLIENQKFDRC